MTCPYLEYRDLETADTGVPRAYCTATAQFVQPLRADICNDRYELSHERDCEIYHAHATDVGDGGTVDAPGGSGGQEVDGGGSGEDEGGVDDEHGGSDEDDTDSEVDRT